MKILLIEDHKMVASSLKMSLEIDKSIQVDIFNNIENFKTDDFLLNYDLLLIDINLTGMQGTVNGLDLAEEIIEEYPNIKIVILTAYKLEYYITRAKKIGCRGFISKEEETGKLINHIKTVVEKDKSVFIEKNSNIEELTRTEIKIIRLYASGMSRKELARELCTNVRSLAVSLSRIYQKLDVRNYQEMVDKVRKLGYVDPF